MMPEDSLLDHALVRLDEAAAHISIDPDVIEQLKYARETTQVRLMIRMDDGSRNSFLAWRCRYDDTRGPTKGGFRYHPAASVEEVHTRKNVVSGTSVSLRVDLGGRRIIKITKIQKKDNINKTQK